ncbi:hypothetical protein K8S17_00670 [bacterium]|nr:hypothetical protein [bacterium]
MRKALFAMAVLALVVSTASASAGHTSDLRRTTLHDLVHQLEQTIPPTWRIVEADSTSMPIGWSGSGEGLYVMLEDTRTRFFHPNGFHYYSFYRVWLLPPDWEGEMRLTPYTSDSAPAHLLGVSDAYSVFYHTAGGNSWREGPKALCDALVLERICFTNLTRRVVDLEFEQRLKASVASVEDDGSTLVLSPQRIIGLTGDGPNLYLAYIFADGPEEEQTPLAAMTERLAEDVFVAFPEVESLYLRRCRTDTFTDTIVTRD